MEGALAAEPASVVLLLERARLVDDLASRDEALAAYAQVLRTEPGRYEAMLRFGTLLAANGDADAARAVLAETIRRHPERGTPRACLAALVLDDDPAAALRLYEEAAALEPTQAEIEHGVAIALLRLGRFADAAAQWRRAFPGGAFHETPYRGAGTPVRVFMLVSALGGNLLLHHVLDDRLFAVTSLTVESAPDDVALPPHDVLLNGIGDADRCVAALARAAALVARDGGTVVNDPQRVAATSREANARRLAAVDGLLAPPVRRLRRDALADPGLGWPLLLRSPGYHLGEHFDRVESPGELGGAAARLPGDELLAIGFVDVRRGDGLFRKYRLMTIGGALYPLHLAISEDWKVHYVTAGMAEHAERRAEEAAFLADPAAALGTAGLAALERAAGVLGLDYGGFDVGPLPDGRLVVFEANATMTIFPPDPDPRWDYRREPIARALAAARALLGVRGSVNGG